MGRTGGSRGSKEAWARGRNEKNIGYNKITKDGGARVFVSFLFSFTPATRLSKSINTKYSEYRDATLCSYVIKPVKPDTGLRLARLVVHVDRDVATLDGVDFLLLRDVFRELAVVAAVHDHGEHGGADEVPE